MTIEISNNMLGMCWYVSIPCEPNMKSLTNMSTDVKIDKLGVVDGAS